MKRGRDYDGSILNAMDIRAFPFDMDDIKLEFETSSTWMSFDESRRGRGAPGQKGGTTYHLQPVTEEVRHSVYASHFYAWSAL
jgi:hypothetical protein